MAAKTKFPVLDFPIRGLTIPREKLDAAVDAALLQYKAARKKRSAKAENKR